MSDDLSKHALLMVAVMVPLLALIFVFSFVVGYVLTGLMR